MNVPMVIKAQKNDLQNMIAAFDAHYLRAEYT